MATSILGLKNDFVDGGPADADWFDAVADSVELARFGYVSIDIAGTGNYTLDPDTEAPAKVLTLAGALTGARNLIVPTSWAGAEWLIYNSTSGAFTLTVKTAAGDGIVIGSGKAAKVWTDGVRVLRLTADVTPTS